MKKEEIISVLSELHKISGLRVSLHGTDFNEIAAYPEEKLPFCANVQKSESEYKRCRECDAEACRRVFSTGEAYAYKCRHGLSEVICPLYNFGTLTGYIMMGQAADEHVNRKALKSALMATGATEEQARIVTDGISEVSSDSVEFAEGLRRATGLYVSEGREYGECARSFIRINLATQRERLLDGLSRLESYLDGLKKQNK